MPKKTFHQEPYFDDFDIKKGFHKILFKPKQAVQTRELNQLQSILDGQIEQFGNHIFKHGSMVSDSVVKYVNDIDYVRLKSRANGDDSQEINFTQLYNKKIVGDTSGVEAIVIHYTKENDVDPSTIFVKYTKTGTDEKTQVFLNGEKLNVIDNDSGEVYYFVEVLCPECPNESQEFNEEGISPTGKGSMFSVTKGFWYVFGYFVYVDDQLIVLDKYDTSPNALVGFTIVQEVIQSNDDYSLLDNALGYPNYTSDGADRLRITLNLEKRPLESNLDNNDEWVSLARISSGILQNIEDKPQYSVIMDMIARRTYDESGDYTVRPFLISFKNMLKSSPDSNDGIKYVDPVSNDVETYNYYANKFVALFTTGKAYVRGYEIERISESYVEIDKARDYATTEKASIRTSQGNYIFVSLAKNGAGEYTSSILPLIDVAENTTIPIDFEEVKLFDGVLVDGHVTGNGIGHAKIKSMEKVGDNRYKLYLFDISFVDSTNDFSQVRGIRKSGVNEFVAQTISDDVIFNSGIMYPKIYNPIPNNLLIPLPHEFTRTVDNVSFMLRRKIIGTTNANGVANFGVNGDEYLQPFNPNTWLCGQKIDTQYIPYDLTSSNLTVNDSHNGQITGLEPNTPFVLVVDVRMQNTVSPKEKTLVEKVFNYNLTLSNNSDPISTEINDAWKIVSVKDITDSNDPKDITDEFTLHKNIFDNYYGISTITHDVGITADKTIEIVVQYFDRVGAGFGTYFSPNSYTTLINDPNNDFGYEDIPTYKAMDGNTYSMREVFDFRPDIKNPDSYNNKFDEINTIIPVRDSNIIYDITYYLPRRDIVVITQEGEFVAIKGIPSLDPKFPSIPENTMKIYDLTLDAYTIDPKTSVKADYVDNRRFTMRDIGEIEHRVDNLEYYMTLSQLEDSTANLNITDANGLNKYKNGLITDTFSDTSSSNIENSEYNCSLDTDNHELRPAFKVRNTNLILDEQNSENFVKKDNIILSQYTEVIHDEQKQASKSISVNPYWVFNWEGVVVLDKKEDSWKDVHKKPDIVINSTNTFGNINASPNALDNIWQSWNKYEILTGKNVKISKNSKKNSVVKGNKRYITTTTTTTTTTTGKSKSVKEMMQKISQNSTNISLIPHIRAQSIKFYASQMRPNTRVYPVFDGVMVGDYCRPLNGTNGSPLTTDSNGNLAGVFDLPNNDKIKFLVGDRVFALTDSPTDSQDFIDTVSTHAQTKFWSGGISYDSQSVFVKSKQEEEKTKTSTTKTTKTSTEVIIVPPPPIKPPETGTTGSPPCNQKILKFVQQYGRNDASVLYSHFIKTRRCDWYPIKKTKLVIEKTQSKTNSAGLKSFIIRYKFVYPHSERVNAVNQAQQKATTSGAKVYPSPTISSRTSAFARDSFRLFCYPAGTHGRTTVVEPLAQSFSTDGKYGNFITSIDIFFEKKDDNESVWLEVRELDNGYPASKVLDYSHVVKYPKDIEVSSYSDKPITFEFSAPVFLEPNTDYCFVVGSNSLNYRIFVAEMGQRDLKTNTMIDGKAHAGSMFKSQNNKTWNAVQTTDITFVMKKADFNRNPMVLKYKNDEVSADRLSNDAIETEASSNIVRIYHKSHGFIPNDKMKLRLYDYSTFKVQRLSGKFISGQVLKHGLSKCEVVSAKPTNEADIYMVTIKNLYGKIIKNNVYSSDIVFETIGLPAMARSLGFGDPNIFQAKYKNGKSPVTCAFLEETVNDVNGIDIERLTEEYHVIKEVNSSDEYTIELVGNNSIADTTGRCDLPNIQVVPNIQVDALEINSKFLQHDSTISSSYFGVAHSGVGSEFAGMDYHDVDLFEIEVNELTHLNKPLKVANSVNELNKMVTVGRSSSDVTLKFESINYDANVSPIVYEDITSLTLVSNRIEMNDCLTYSTAPNATKDGQALDCNANNGRFTLETDPKDGSTICKYVVNKVNLRNPANSMRIYADIYQPLSGKVEFWYKTLPVESTQDLDSMEWKKGEYTQEVVSEQLDDFKEIEILIGDPDYALTPIPEYKEFKVKIVMSSTNSANPPKVKNFRAIAVTS